MRLSSLRIKGQCETARHLISQKKIQNYKPKHSFNIVSSASEGYGRIPTKAYSFILKYSLWHSLNVFPQDKAKAKIPPVLVPATQSKQWMIGLPTASSRAISIWMRTRPRMPPPSRHRSLKYVRVFSFLFILNGRQMSRWATWWKVVVGHGHFQR